MMYMSSNYRLLLIFMVYIFTAGSLHGEAKVVYVTEGGSGSGDSWESSASLQGAFANLDYSTNDTQVFWVAGGNYFPSSSNDRTECFKINSHTNKPVKLLGGFNGTEDSA